MTYPSSLDLGVIVNYVIEVAPGVAAAPGFNELLVLGPSTHIPVDARVYEFTKTEDMLAYGFLVTDPEYKAAQLYFSQTPRPAKIMIGRRDLTSSPPETRLQALQACRNKSRNWYMAMVTDAERIDIEDIAAYIETASPLSLFGYTSQDADIIVDVDTDIMSFLKNKSYKRTIGQYSTKNLLAIASIFGYACGQNTGLANSAFTLKFKQEVGVDTEPIDMNTLGIVERKNGNLYLYYNDFYKFFEQGVMANGWFFDRMINLDMFATNIQYMVANLLYSSVKVPQTEAGMSQIAGAIQEACEVACAIGYIGPGVWKGGTVLKLFNGDVLPKGYCIQSQPLSEQTDADRAARKAPPFYVSIIEAGAVHSLTVQINVRT